MFRITKAFENEQTAIYKVEGRIGEDLVVVWKEELTELQNHRDRQIILDLCQVWHFCQKAIDTLIHEGSHHLYLLNCSMEVRNTLQAAGLASRILG